MDFIEQENALKGINLRYQVGATRSKATNALSMYYHEMMGLYDMAALAALIMTGQREFESHAGRLVIELL